MFESFVSRGVPSNRLMALFNRVSPDVALDMDAASEYVEISRRGWARSLKTPRSSA